MGQSELMIPMAGLIDKDAELARLDKEAETHGEIKRIEGKLGNVEGFVAKAPSGYRERA
ncbi:hypothetical protein OH492_03500 [Vibrio chagasii]|nr:hypothetical protein [Vibrio chagasii]